MNKNTIIVSVLVGIAVVVGYLFAPSGNATLGSGNGGYTTAITSLEKLVTSTASNVVSTTTNRIYLRITNASTTGSIFCNASGGAPARSTARSVLIPALNSYTFSDAEDNLYRGAVSCATAGGNASTTVYER